jgi:hypothetical protein
MPADFCRRCLRDRGRSLYEMPGLLAIVRYARSLVVEHIHDGSEIEILEGPEPPREGPVQ